MTQEETNEKLTINTSLGPNNTVEKTIHEDVVWIDNAFYVKKTRYGLYTSILREPLGANFLSGATEDGVLQMTRWHLKSLQDGTLGQYSRVVNSAVVEGKL